MKRAEARLLLVASEPAMTPLVLGLELGFETAAEAGIGTARAFGNRQEHARGDNRDWCGQQV
jgi:hypothetical protein